MNLLSKIKQLFIIIAFLCIIIQPQESSARGACIAASDFGLGGSIYVPANPDDGLATNGTRLLRDKPKKSQVAPWIDSGFFTLGNPPDDRDIHKNKLKVTITGSWDPWGSIGGVTLPICQLISCNPANPKQVCYPNGQIVDDNNLATLPCTLDKGWGLYGLIALPSTGGGTYTNPNSLEASLSLPKSLYRTFKLAPAIQGTRISAADSAEDPVYEYVFELDATEVCDTNHCVKDVHSEGGEYIMRGRLYFKMLDNYYQDNTGGYNVTVINGVYRTKGFIESTLGMFEKTISAVVASLTNNMLHNLKLVLIIKTILLLYVVFTGIMYTMGLIHSSRKEMIVKLLKFAFVATLVSDSGMDFFNQYLFGLCRDGARSIGSMIINATLYYGGDINSPIYYMPRDASPLTVYDVLLTILTKLPIHAKTLSLLFYKWQLYWIPCIYIVLYFIIKAILKSVMLYALMLIQIALLMIVAPIFIIMMLFKLTYGLFDVWVKQVIATGILYIMMATSIGLMMRLIFDQIQALLYFRVCWDVVWSFKIFGLTILEIVFWYPQNDSEYLQAMTPMNFLACLLMGYVFLNLMDKIPQMVDIITGSSKGAMGSMYKGGLGAYQANFIKRGIEKGFEKAGQAVAMGISYVDGGVTMKVIGTVQRTAGAIQASIQKFDKTVGENNEFTDKTIEHQHNWIDPKAKEHVKKIMNKGVKTS